MRILALSLMLSFTISGYAQQGSFWEQELSPELKDELDQIWRPAPTPPGAIDWGVLTEIDVQEEVVNDFIQYVPTFTPLVKNLDGKTVKLNGYMVPLEASDLQSHFILMAYPHACPFHMPGGPGGYVEIQADFPVKFSYDPMLIEGHFQILEDYSNGIFYRITAARQASNTE